MIELFEQDVQSISRQSSKGNQLKWKNQDMWYKADYTGYEGLAEYVVSKLIESSTLPENLKASYDLEEIRYKSSIYQGVQSKNFLEEGWSLITLERLFHSMFGGSLYKALFQIEDHKDRLIFLVNQVERITGIQAFGCYMNQVLTIDALFLNEDRHTHNLAILMNGQGEFELCPIFDHGAALLSDTTLDYPLTEDVIQLVDEVKAKTISVDFEEQLDISEELYGENLKFSFSKREVERILGSVTEYSVEEVTRVKEILYLQMRKYPYLFVEK